ncbi:glucose-1-phosphate cytidylyltransferase [Limisphaera ngatamarikiensis]|uniref:Glucose-1-phosphate cytidylyltransferase n=1 Tax=Limisphaera ngatamarikiensis TaxID=1324935 RepID=A0A6M1RLY8_9BACT|nr:glucose-1-phosphate cytidylyltransferase [Limisphaera ngatamarikiensis]NGO38569.1 glucose-1-phosphate cytidylyltransferase [Limisphaera ngatamarikiensis]
MKVVIFCGGMGTRLREETEFRPKPMVPIGDRPILWHIMKLYAHYGHKEFILCLGYKGEIIKEYFRNYQWFTSDVTLRLGPRPRIKYHNQHPEEDWVVTLVDTGLHTQTGGRLKRALRFIDDDTFLCTYGDGLTDSDINASIAFHRRQKKIVTITAVRPTGRFGDLEIEGDRVVAFNEKPEKQTNYINGGFFVMDRRIEQYLTDDNCVLEREPLERLAAEGQIAAWRHDGFWQCMDTYREQQLLTQLWNSGQAPWKVWAR